MSGELKIYNDSNYRELLLGGRHTDDGSPEALPRQTWYGSPEAEACGLVAVEDFPDEIPDWLDVKEIIADCHAKKLFAYYHFDAKQCFKDGWYQGRYGFCWAYGATAAVMSCRAVENQPTIRLSPFSLGWLTGWQNQGYYLDRTLAGLKDRGVAPVEFVPEYNLSPRTFKEGWEEEAMKNRVTSWWDTGGRRDVKLFIRQCLAILKTSRFGYIAYDWWSHALGCCGLEWSEREKNNVIWWDWNSHADGLIKLTGDRGVPDEFYGVRATT